MNQPLLISQANADRVTEALGELPPGIEVYPVYPPLNKTVFTECVWLRRLGDFAHIHPTSMPCPQEDKRQAAPPWRKPWRF